jgi:hypothetical protein
MGFHHAWHDVAWLQADLLAEETDPPVEPAT